MKTHLAFTDRSGEGASHEVWAGWVKGQALYRVCWLHDCEPMGAAKCFVN